MRTFVALFLFILVSCQVANEETEKNASLFVAKNEISGIHFENNLSYTEAFNPYIYRNFYNGGGVAIGDVNNDGLEDIYFSGNMVDNKLFLNKGNWEFEDITDEAGVACPGVWSTGATFADVNGDGFLDLYVCKSGKQEGVNRHNELFINNGHSAGSGQVTFTESSKEYGLDVEGLSVHSAFFDYDKDGDLDVYLLNNSLKSVGGFELVKDLRKIPDITGNGNKFFRNDNDKFIDITQEIGIFSSKIGFGLGITLGDFNNDHWTDIYITNDFFEKDYLYINDTQGGFTENLEDYFGSISMGAMGADFADLDNDRLPDLMVSEMLPATLERQKTKTVFENWEKYQLAKQQGYFNQYARNTLQRNLGKDQFIEIGRQANISATEWSWSTLLFDMDNDGLRDIFITNGIPKDLLDRDYLAYGANDETIRNRITNNEKDVILKLIDAMPSLAIPNAALHNLGDFHFENKSQDWGLSTPSFSNGSAYADLDNDGDLDLVTNNLNMPSFIYENTTDTLTHRSISLKLAQKGKNSHAIGASVTIFYDNGKKSFGENFVSRGFQSSVQHGLHFGVGNVKKIDSLWVNWPDGATSVLADLATNKTYTLEHPEKIDATRAASKHEGKKSLFKEISPLFDFSHKENAYVDFNNERLLTQMYSNEGPAFASEDINNDGRADFFIGGAKNQSGRLFISSSDSYQEVLTPFEKEVGAEDTDAVFFDGDNDGDMDLYVCHGGKAFSPYSTALHDTYYSNEDGRFTKKNIQPTFPIAVSSSVVKPADYDNDGDIDLFVGERYKTNLYGQPGSGYLLENDGNGNFKSLDSKTFDEIGMITDAAWTDLNNDSWQDLIVIGEWMDIMVFINQKGELINESTSFGLNNTSGLWNALEIVDVDGDEDQDLVVGNLGLNTFFEADMRMYIADFDGNGFQEQLICKKKNGKYYPIVEKDELVAQIPSLKKKLLYYKDYGKADMVSTFSEEVLETTSFFDLQLLESTIFFNENGRFIAKKLPSELQYAPIYAITASDIDEDGHVDLFFGGNQYFVKPQFGRYDASLGWAIFGPYTKNQPKSTVIPMGIKGQIRALEWIDQENKKVLVAPMNDEKTKFYVIEK